MDVEVGHVLYVHVVAEVGPGGAVVEKRVGQVAPPCLARIIEPLNHDLSLVNSRHIIYF